MNQLFKIILSLVFVLTLSACAYSEPNAKFTVTGIGFSKDNQTVKAYLQTIDFEATQNGNTNTFLTQGEGDSIFSALNSVKTKLSKEPSFEHCQIIFISNGIEGEMFSEALVFCEELGMSQRVTVAYTNNIQGALANSKITSGAEMVSLIKQNAKVWGVGKHTALFEIKTAILVNGGNFSLVNIEAKNDEIKFSGLTEYKNGEKERTK